MERLSNKNTKISIAYKGASLSEEECKRMFFTKPRFSIVGHGLRMHLCKKIIDFHNGKIKVHSYKDVNEFTFTIPKNDNNFPLKTFKTSLLRLS